MERFHYHYKYTVIPHPLHSHHSNCADYDLCEWCEPNSGSIHPRDHLFLKIKIPGPRIGVGRDAKPRPLLKRNVYTHQRSSDTVLRYQTILYMCSPF